MSKENLYHHYIGFVNTSNIEGIAVAIEKLLSQAPYTFVSINSGLMSVQVETSSVLNKVYVTEFEGGWKHLGWHDSYGSFGFSTKWDSAYKQDEDHPFISIQHHRFDLKHKAPAGFDLHWIFTLENR